MLPCSAACWWSGIREREKTKAVWTKTGFVGRGMFGVPVAAGARWVGGGGSRGSTIGWDDRTLCAHHGEENQQYEEDAPATAAWLDMERQTAERQVRRNH